MQLILVPLTLDRHRLICDLHQLYKLTPPTTEPEQAIIIEADNAIVGGAYIYETKPFMFAEYFILNPYQPIRVRHQTAKLMISQFMAHAVSKGLIPFCMPRSPGLARMLKRAGFLNTGVPCYANEFPALPVSNKKDFPAYKPKKKATRKRKKTIKEPEAVAPSKSKGGLNTTASVTE